MPRQQPYTQTLSALRKDDLIRLSREFKLPPEGSVVTLRNRLRVYMNAHREVLYRNQRYKSLYPKHRQPNNPPPPPPPHFTPPPSPSALSYISDAPSWYGIGIDHFDQPPQDHQPSFSPPPMPQEAADDYYPPPSPTPLVSDFGSPPYEAQIAGMRSFFSLETSFVSLLFGGLFAHLYFLFRIIATLCSPPSFMTCRVVFSYILPYLRPSLLRTL